MAATASFVRGLVPASPSSSRARETWRAVARAEEDVLFVKNALMDEIHVFRNIKAQKGGVAVDFGVRGGELNENRIPNNLVASRKYYKVSEELGKAADRVVELVEQLGELGAGLEPTRFFGTAEGALNGLHGGAHLY